MPSEICPKCHKAVYAAEKKIAGGKAWHSMCLKCGLCNKMLDSTTVAEHEGEVFCKQCHGRKFGPKGYGFGGGAGALNMDSGTHLGNVGTEMGNKPTTAAGGGTVVPPEQGGCPRCGKRVYDAEKAIGCPSGLSFHKACFRCKTCGKSLDSTTLCTQKEEREIYCKACYGKNFGPKGFGFGQGAGALNMG
ncbi:Cysteine and glycine rich protein 1 [Fasciola gigantica]|uniref:Cysteine and glycine rich protein 1 n=2 Tax=Fasciola TaxID=6191 RepID=A0A4E0RTQ8_FASHE|nr:Cysteine and glycine rich protein 1 [Fasciola hepatica]TPP67413.1 Cysteine and glycine rich protein 1 [Fasciola gigantica]